MFYVVQVEVKCTTKVNATAPSLMIQVYAVLSSRPHDESFAIDNVKITKVAGVCVCVCACVCVYTTEREKGRDD